MPMLSRCVDQILGALERGSPVAAVLLDHAHDGRDTAKRRLLESAGKKEVAMHVPTDSLLGCFSSSPSRSDEKLEGPT